MASVQKVKHFQKVFKKHSHDKAIQEILIADHAEFEAVVGHLNLEKKPLSSGVLISALEKNGYEVMLHCTKNGDATIAHKAAEAMARGLSHNKSVDDVEGTNHCFSTGVTDLFTDWLCGEDPQKRDMAHHFFLNILVSNPYAKRELSANSRVVNVLLEMAKLRKNLSGPSALKNIMLFGDTAKEFWELVISSKVFEFTNMKELGDSPTIRDIKDVSASFNMMASRIPLLHPKEQMGEIFKIAYQNMTKTDANEDFKLAAAKLITKVLVPVDYKPLTLRTEIFDEFVKWITTGSSKQQKKAAVYFVTITDNCDETQLALLQDSSLVNTLLDRKQFDTIFNMAQHEDAKRLLPVERIEEDLSKILKSNSSNEIAIELLSLLCDPDKVSTIKLDKRFVEGHLSSLRRSLLGVTASHSLYEILLVLSNCSVSDHNKEILGELGIVKILIEIVQITSSSFYRVAQGLTVSRREACKILWNLAFTTKNRQRILDANGIEVLTKIAEDPAESGLHANAKGALWMLKNEDILLPKPPGSLDATPQNGQPQPSVEPKQSHQITEQNPNQTGHIMISYNWGVQPLVLKLAATLKAAGFHVWLDIEQMKGSTLEAMADALENSVLVLVCMTEKYKDSPNCRLEGQYCVTLKKRFIPLLMQDNYKPTGWLGLMLGAKLYHRFVDDHKWEENIANLFREISSSVQPLLTVPTVPEVLSLQAPTTEHNSKTTGAEVWSVAQVIEWLQKVELGHLQPFMEKAQMNGKCLQEILVLSPAKSSSDFTVFKGLLREWAEEIGLTFSFRDALLLLHELKKLKWE